MSDFTHANGELRSQAESCLSAGLSVLPAVRRGDEKRTTLTTWKPYQTRLPTSGELDAWFDHAAAMCIVCGQVSGNLEMIDFDLEATAFEPWCRSVQAAAPGLLERLVIESTPSGGRHVVYRCETPVCGNTKLAQRRIALDSDEPVVVGSREYTPRRDATGEWSVTITMIETRGEGGLFLCAPSSGYELLQGDLALPPVITSDERDILLGCAWALDEAPKPVVGAASTAAAPSASVRPGDDFNDRGDPGDVLARHGWTLVKHADSGGNEHWRRPGKSSGTSATLKDRVFYVFSTNAPPFEPHQGYSPFAVYALLEHSGDFTAAASALGSDGYGQLDEANHGVDLSGFIPTPDIAPSDDLLAAPVPVEDLIATFPRLRRPVIHGLLREGETMNVIASSKTGKSWLTTDLAIAVATGRPWLDRYATEAGDVLIIDNELHGETSANRVPKVAQAREVPLREFGRRLYIENLRGRLRDINALTPYFESLEPGRFRVIVLDAFYRFMPAGGDENDNGTMANIYNRIDSFADRLGCCFVLIHHATKGSQSGKSVTDVGAGAGAQSRATDTHLVLRPHEEEKVIVLDAAVRSWPPIEPTCLRWSFPLWNPDESLDPSELKSDRPSRRKKEPAAKAEAPKPDPWSVERFVEQFISAEPTTIAELREQAAQMPGLSWRRVADFLAISERRELVKKVRLPGRGGPQGYVLATAEWHEEAQS